MILNLDKAAWKRVAFGDVIENVTDRVDNPSQAGVDRYVGLEHLDPGVMIVQRWDTPGKVEAQKLRFQSGDVIFGRRRAYQKKVALAEFAGICSAHALVLRVRPDYVHPEFLPVFLSSDYFLDRAIAISVGSLSPTVNWRDLKVQEFDLPPLDEQKRIADLLWAVERHQVELEAQVSATAGALQRFLADAFRTASGPSVAIVDLCTDIVGGIWGSPEGEGEVNVLALGPRIYAPGTTDFVTDGSPVRAVSKRQAESRLVRADDIILERSGGSPTQAVGRVVIAGPGLPPCIPTDFQRLLRPNRDLVEPRYLFWRLRHDWTEGLTRDYSKKTTNITNLSVKDYIAREIRVPSLVDQAVLLSRVSTFQIALLAVSAELSALRSLRSSVLADVFGEN
ncbi:MAG: restriction endonuclease subunit S [Streptosporangiaceae bacterium]